MLAYLAARPLLKFVVECIIIAVIVEIAAMIASIARPYVFRAFEATRTRYIERRDAKIEAKRQRDEAVAGGLRLV
jgi:hypothetical protein